MSSTSVSRSDRWTFVIVHGVIFAGGVIVGAILTYLVSPKFELASSMFHIDYVRSVDDFERAGVSLANDGYGGRALVFDLPTIEVLKNDVHTIGVQQNIGFHQQVRLDRIPGWMNTKVICAPSRSETRVDVEFQVKWDVHRQVVQLGDCCARVIELPLGPGENGEKYYAVLYLIQNQR